MKSAPVVTSAWWALRHHGRSALAVAFVAAAGVVCSAPGLWLTPRPQVEPLRDAPWRGDWSSLSLTANAARDLAVGALTETVWATGLAALIVAALTILALSVVRSAQSRSEIVIRRGVGASRRVLLGSASLEGGIIALLGLSAGLAGAAALPLLLPSAWRVYPSALLLVGAVGAVVVMGALLPLTFARSRVPGAHGTAGHVPLVVPAVQFGLALMGVLAGSQLSHRVETADTARRPGNGTIVPLAFDRATRNVPELLAAALREARGDPGVALVSVSSPGTLLGLGQVDIITTECGRCSQGGLPKPLSVSQATHHLASADTFQALDLRPVAGRLLSDADQQGAERVAVVNRYLADREFEGGQAVGRHVRVGGPDNWYRVVGIVDDGRFDALGAAAVPRRRVYLSALQHDAEQIDLLMRTTDGRATAVPGVVSAGAGPAITEAALHHREAEAARWFGRALLIPGWGALLLATFGMLAVMRLWVADTVPELALRRAVGARRRHVLGRALACAGVVVGGGLALAWWLEPLSSAALARAMSALPAATPALLGVPLLLLSVATLGATLLAAWRAARAAPATLPGFSDL